MQDLIQRTVFREDHEQFRDAVRHFFDKEIVPMTTLKSVVDKETGIHAVDRKTGELRPLADPEPDMPGNWFNDAKCDRLGRLWAGSGDRHETAPTGRLYVFERDHSWRAVDSGIICSNGTAFSPDGRVAYFSDSCAQQIVRYDIDPATGDIGPRRPFVKIGEENVQPDGMTVDAEGGIWVALWDGWRIERYTPGGKLDRTVKLPVPRRGGGSARVGMLGSPGPPRPTISTR